ncbi:hypothetical protein BDR03DRAFT_970618 [Suillus americanus]|nr:hypothetical protein BDR03DRAFT_970618 [Suillus americanus]
MCDSTLQASPSSNSYSGVSCCGLGEYGFSSAGSSSLRDPDFKRLKDSVSFDCECYETKAICDEDIDECACETGGF